MSSANATFARRTIAAAGVAFVVSAFCVWAGTWQYSRHAERADAHAAYVEASGAPEAPVGAALLACGDGSYGCDRWEYRTVAATGAFLADSETLLRNRRVEGVRAVHALVWFQLDSGEVMLVDAGWRPADSPGGDDTVQSTSTEITVVLRAFEDDDGKRDDGATRIHPAHLPDVDGAFVPLYGVLQDPCAPESCHPYPATAVNVAEPTLGPHLAYAFQWWIFAALAPVGVMVLLRRDRERAAGDESPPRPERRSARGGASDEEIEDAL